MLFIPLLVYKRKCALMICSVSALRKDLKLTVTTYRMLNLHNRSTIAKWKLNLKVVLLFAVHSPHLKTEN